MNATREMYSDESTWLEARKGCIGGSIAAAVLGVDEYRTPFTAWATICNIADEEPSIAMICGQELEPAIKRLAERVGGLRLVGLPRYTLYRHPERRWQIATPDDFVASEEVGFEAKAIGANNASRWGEGGDEVPDAALVQVMHSMAVTGARAWYIGALIGSTDFRLFKIMRDDELIDDIVRREEDFYHRYIETRTAPPLDGSDAAKEYFRKLFPVDTEPVRRLSTPEEIAAFVRLREARIAYAEAEREREAAELAMKVMIGNAAGVEYQGETVSFKTQSVTRTDWKQVAMSLGATKDVIDKYTVSQQVRVLRIPQTWRKTQ